MKGSELYDELIVQHSRNPINFSKNPDAQHQLEAYNPFCGDQYKLYFDIDSESIQDLSFHGYGCAISKASSSALVELLQGKTLEEAKSLCDEFLAMVRQHSQVPERLKHISMFMKAKEYPGRDKCATLSWEHLGEYLENILK